jgi:hypothetical protein
MGQPINGDSDNRNNPGIPGVLGKSTIFNGVLGYTTAEGHAGVAGACDEGNGNGLYGRSKNRNGVYGTSSSKDNNGVVGFNDGGGNGVLGHSPDGIGVLGLSEKNMGIYGKSKNQNGVYGNSSSKDNNGVAGFNDGGGNGVLGHSKNGIGVFAKSEISEAVHAETNSQITAAIAAYNTNPEGTGAAIYAKKEGKGVAGFFEGNLYVTGNITARGDLILEGADLAENFTALETEIEPGAVMSLTESGELQKSSTSYDKKVAGVISGAGLYKPAIILDRKEGAINQCPIAMIGKVCVNVCDINGPIEVGDLLTTSDIAGFAMKATDPVRAFGAVIGKALKPLNSGKGLIPILISLQ